MKSRPPHYSLFSIQYSVFIALAFFLLPLSLFLLFPPPALAQGEGSNAGVKQNPYWRKDTRSVVKEVESGSEKEVTSARFTFTQFNNTLSAMGSGILDPTGQNQSAVSQIGSGIALIIGHPAINTQQYLAYMGSKAGFVDQAYAQNTGGFGVLAPIQKMWIATRNVAYLITSLILVVIGFMIMLRKKIDAQTVIGVQQALPGLVVTLLLITFSYAIAGFVIDMIYFITYFSVKLLALNNVFSDGGAGVLDHIRNNSLFTIGLGNLFGGIHLGPVETGSAPTETAADAIGNLVEAITTSTFGAAAGTISEWVSQPIAFVIIAVAILYALFKLFFALLMSYIQIIALAILGPLQLMLNALPGSDMFSKWFRNLLANAMAFPAAIMMLIFAAVLMGLQSSPWNINKGIGFQDSASGVAWTAPLIFGSGGGFKTNPADAVMALLGLGVLLMTPKVVEMVKEAFQAPEFKYGSAIGEAMGFGWGRTGGFASDYLAQRQASIDQLRMSFYQREGRAPSPGELRTLMPLGGVPRGWGIPLDILKKQLGLKK